MPTNSALACRSSSRRSTSSCSRLPAPPPTPSFPCRSIIVLAGSLALMIFIRPVMSWEFAITTSGQIKFYDNDWHEVTTAAHMFDELSAIAYDETDDTLYFNDKTHHNGSIFSLRLSASDHQSHRIERVVSKSDTELIQGIAFDPLERTLYWTDARNRKILQLRINRNNSDATTTSTVESGNATVWLNISDATKPQGIAVDACRRKVYWTNWTPKDGSTIMRAFVDGSKREVIVSMLDMPLGIVVDQYSRRLYWVDDLQGVHYSVESAALDGTDRRTLVRDLNNAPRNLAVDRNTVYWTDETYRSVWKVAKNVTHGKPEKVLAFAAAPNGIIVRDNLLSAQTDNVECATTIARIREQLQVVTATLTTAGIALTPNASSSAAPAETSAAQVQGGRVMHNWCLNNGTLIENTNKCICAKGFTGSACELPVCHNYCVHGKCYTSSTGVAECTCSTGYTGERCERDVCSSFCLNGGRCDVEKEEEDAAGTGVPVCHCEPTFSGRRCESMDETEACRRYCASGDELAGFNMRDLCGNCSATVDVHVDTTDASTSTSASPSTSTAATTDKLTSTAATTDKLTACESVTSSAVNLTAILVSAGVVLSLALVYLIVFAVRQYKQPTPHIKKTFVVRSRMDRSNRTPLTCRPAPDQCEVTIENCCNMNICDTPCFDPKTIQQEMNKETARKEDKYKLLSNMDGDLY